MQGYVSEDNGIGDQEQQQHRDHQEGLLGEFLEDEKQENDDCGEAEFVRIVVPKILPRREEVDRSSQVVVMENSPSGPKQQGTKRQKISRTNSGSPSSRRANLTLKVGNSNSTDHNMLLQITPTHRGEDHINRYNDNQSQVAPVQSPSAASIASCGSFTNLLLGFGGPSPGVSPRYFPQQYQQQQQQVSGSSSSSSSSSSGSNISGSRTVSNRGSYIGTNVRKTKVETNMEETGMNYEDEDAISREEGLEPFSVASKPHASSSSSSSSSYHRYVGAAPHHEPGLYRDALRGFDNFVLEEYQGSNRTEQKESLDDVLNVKEATWFLDTFESYNMSKLTPEQAAIIEQTKLRSKVKHRASILFFEDVEFILNKHHDFRIDWNDAKCRKDPKKWIIHHLCKVVVDAFPCSIMHKNDRSCIWSALMDRALFHLEQSGFTDCSIASSASSNREATLYVGEYHISRSNFTKVFKRYCK